MRSEPLSVRLERWSIPEPNSGCTLWYGVRQRDWHGMITHNGRMIGAHRAAWIVAHGAIPRGTFVLHKCDNPVCVNESHLYLGDAAANMADMVRRGRSPNANKKCCAKGHEYSQENTYYRKDRPGRNCRSCVRAATSALSKRLASV